MSQVRLALVKQVEEGEICCKNLDSDLEVTSA
jgi:hypothetical protein